MQTKKIFSKNSFFLLVLFFFAFLVRVYGLTSYFSFWSDEEHTALMARAILERGKPVLANGYQTGPIYQQFLYWLTAGSMKVFGVNELAVRLPAVVFGSLTVLAVYLLGKEIFNKRVGLLAAFLIAFLKIEILWSRQARPYQMLQFFFILGAYFIYRYVSGLRVVCGVKKKENWLIVGFLLCAVCASFSHGLGLVLFLDGILFLTLSNFKKTWKVVVLLLLSIFLTFIYFSRREIRPNLFVLGKINNLFYYRILMTKNYLILGILGGLGGIGTVLKGGFKKILLFLIFLGTQIFIVSLLLRQPFIRYFYITLPFIVLLSCYFVYELTGCLPALLHKALQAGGFRVAIRNKEKKKFGNLRILAFVICSFFLLGCLYVKDKLVLWPQKVYSLNEDMQEIPEVDWKKIYKFVGEKLKENQEAVLVTNWNDLPIWYLGEGKLNYIVRIKNYDKEKDPVSEALIIDSLAGFKEIIEKNKRGYFILDSWDDQVPEGVREYCHRNLKREWEIDRLYSVQPRYWTVWIYSWGTETI